MTALSEHFTLEELTASETAYRLRINNTPTGQNLANIKKTAIRMEKVRAIVGGPISVSSCYRSPEVNRSIGGSPTSAHMSALAVDCKAIGMTPMQFAEKLQPHVKALEIDQLILEYRRWVHIGWTNGTPRNQVLTKDEVHNYTPGLH